MPEFQRPRRVPSFVFDALPGAHDPAESTALAHRTAAALVSRVRADPRPPVLDRLVAFADEHGLDAVAELWSAARPCSLPGALWRIYLLHAVAVRSAEECSYLYRRGMESARGIDPVVAGAAVPTGPRELVALTTLILKGLFEGDFAVALERAAAYCRVVSVGCASLADDFDGTEPERSSRLTRRGLRYHTISEDLTGCAALWRQGALE
ncbi:MAG TPA: DNA-directed RNA polymerase subunit beta [Microbacteriaceae bacterium]|nr:DNA-directed RNA polymerase subunit beta [Microbacteriaceae bacterium]